MSWLFISGIYQCGYLFSSHLYSLNVCHVSDDKSDLETKVDTSSFEW